MARIIRPNPDRDENTAPNIADCLAHRCPTHAELPPMDDSADDGAECGPCIGAKYVEAYEKAVEADILKRLFWPLVQSGRDRLNLLAPGAGDRFEEEARGHVSTYDKEIVP
jgi:hypothetical protein